VWRYATYSFDENRQLHYLPVFPWEKKLDEPMGDYAWEVKNKKESQ
jgi:hypothetical protein